MSALTVLTVVAVAYTLIASKLDRWWVSAPMVFVAVGVILGPRVTNVLPVSVSNEVVLTVTELTLALLLFSNATTVRLRDVEGDAKLPSRLLFIGLPLTMIAGTVVALLMFPGVGWAAAALIATILAPTDVALGMAVVTNRVVPVRIRRALNVESGLNDGIVTPFVTLFLAIVAAEEHLAGPAWALQALLQIGLALAVAGVVGFVGGTLCDLARSRHWTSDVSEQIAIFALGLLAYGGAVTFGGNGFVAAFVAGIIFGAVTRRRLEAQVQFTDTVGLTASFLVWSVFGALFVGQLFGPWLSLTALGYAVLSLTIIRMVPVAIALIGTRLRPATVFFMGWFGPRGLASVVFTLLALEEFEHLDGGALLIQTATWAILLSVVLHGVSASPLADLYGNWVRRHQELAENQSASEPQLRVRDLGGRRLPAPPPG